MRKYWHIFKATLIENLQYIFTIILNTFSFILVMYLFINLWNYIYSDTNNLINGYTMKQMIWYVTVTEVLWYGTRCKTLTNQISNDIKGGNIAYNINKPYNYITYIISKYFGEISIKILIFILVGIIFGFISVGGIDNFNFINIPLIFIVVIFGILINVIINIIISMLSFWIEDSTPFHWIYDKLIVVIGTIFPIEMFPTWLQPIIKFSPIYVVTYGPAKLIIDFSTSMFLKILFGQFLYLIITIIILSIMYRIGVKKINVNGG